MQLKTKRSAEAGYQLAGLEVWIGRLRAPVCRSQPLPPSRRRGLFICSRYGSADARQNNTNWRISSWYSKHFVPNVKARRAARSDGGRDRPVRRLRRRPGSRGAQPADARAGAGRAGGLGRMTRVAVIVSRIRVEEKLLLPALEAAGADVQLVNDDEIVLRRSPARAPDRRPTWCSNARSARPAASTPCACWRPRASPPSTATTPPPPAGTSC